MEIIYDLVIDFARPSKTNTVMVAQNDTARKLHFIMLNNKQPFSMTDVSYIYISATTSNGSTLVGGNVEILKDEDGNNINEAIYSLPASLTAHPGTVTLRLELDSVSAQKITSFDIYLTVQNALYDEEAYIPSEDIDGFRELLNKSRETLAKLEAVVAQEELPNPYPLNITIEGEEISYKGDKIEQVTLNNLAYLADDPVTEVEPLDETATSRTAALVEEAKEAAKEAKSSQMDAATSEVNALSYAEATRGWRNEAEGFSRLAAGYAAHAYESEGWAKGTKDGVPVEEGSPFYHNNAAYWASKASVEDRLDSVATDKGLSANQGRILKDMIDSKSIDTSIIDTMIQDQAADGYMSPFYTAPTDRGYMMLYLHYKEYAKLLAGESIQMSTLSYLGSALMIEGDTGQLIESMEATLSGNKMTKITLVSLGIVYTITNPRFLRASKTIRDSIPNKLADLSEDATHRVVTDTEKSNWNAKADSSTVTAIQTDVNALKVSDTTQNTDIATLKTDVASTNQSFIQLYADGFASKNKWKTNPLTLSASVGVNFENPIKQGTYTLKTFEATTSGVFNFFGVTPSGNEAILSGVSWADASNGITFTTNKDYEAFRFYSSANFSGKVQIEEGTEASAYTEYAMPNTDLTHIVDSAIDDGFLIGKNKIIYRILNVNIDGQGKLVTDSTWGVVVARVEKGKTYALTTDDTSYYELAFYNSKPQLNSVSYNASRRIEAVTTVTAPIDGYMALRCRNTYNTPMIEEGNAVTTYEDAVPSNAELKKSFNQITEEKSYTLGVNGVSIVWSSCIVRNGICFLNAEINAPSGISEGATILTGMPKSREWSNFPIMNGSDYTLTFGYVRRDVSEIRTRNALPSGRYILNVTYLV